MELQEKLAHLPSKPGVYLMKNQAGEIIYVGKAINLSNRVRSYFQSARHHSPKVKALVEHIADLEYIVTDSEVEALILENNLIKAHSPWYNIRLKDDKSYPYIKVTVNELYPRIISVRKRLSDGARYFGPYTSAQAVKHTVNFLRKLFPVRTCRKDIQAGQTDRPCLNYHIGRCLAPCAGFVDQAAYGDIIDEVCLFLEGRSERLIKDLKGKMIQASKSLEFERAARIRDQVQSLETIVEKQKIVASHEDDQDVLGYVRMGDLACVQVFFVRNGKLIGREHFLLDCSVEAVEDEILSAFIQQYYSDSSFVPKEILLPFTLSESGIIGQWLETLKQSKVYLHVPQRGEKRHLVEMVTDNAQLVLDEMRAKDERKQQEIERGLWELQHTLKLAHPIKRMEAYDISNTQGNQIVASMVVLINGKPANDQYRRFRIQSVEEGPNDYLAMQEVIRRRFTRGLRERSGVERGEGFSDFPDLVLIDGGKGQLSSTLEIRDQLGIDIPFIGLAKQFEEIYVEGQTTPIILPRESQGLYMVQRIRDEAHRFAITYHRRLRSKASHGSVLDDIVGIGPKRKKALLKHFGSVKRIREAEIVELIAVDGISQKVAEELYQYVRK